MTRTTSLVEPSFSAYSIPPQLFWIFPQSLLWSMIGLIMFLDIETLLHILNYFQSYKTVRRERDLVHSFSMISFQSLYRSQMLSSIHWIHCYRTPSLCQKHINVSLISTPSSKNIRVRPLHLELYFIAYIFYFSRSSHLTYPITLSSPPSPHNHYLLFLPRSSHRTPTLPPPTPFYRSLRSSTTYLIRFKILERLHPYK